MFYVEKKRFTFIGHRVVAQHFIPNPENLPVVNHINSIRDDNRAENLEWMTVKQNMQHMVDTGRSGKNKQKPKGQDSPHSKLTDEDVFYIRANYVKGKFNKEIFDQFDISRSTYDGICWGKRWKHLL